MARRRRGAPPPPAGDPVYSHPWDRRSRELGRPVGRADVKHRAKRGVGVEEADVLQASAPTSDGVRRKRA
ncbi:hypothetical protein BS78_05G095700 [Paspalum vaginatum]|nr:hypothetical protein BS78_05G095700 [Paspalum vaginatum]